MKTSNGEMAIDVTDKRATLRGATINLGDIQRLEMPEDGYTHLIEYDGYDSAKERAVVGSALIGESEARALLCDRLIAVNSTVDADGVQNLIHSLATLGPVEGSLVLAL
jgi:hypothetical protein